MKVLGSLTEWFDNATIGRKIMLICLILVIIPTLVLGLMAYSSAEFAIRESIQTNLETQSQGILEETQNSYDLTMVKVKSDLNVLRQKFYEKADQRS
jgi:hypothetical protein